MASVLHLSSPTFIPEFSVIRRDRDRHGGGIALYVHESMPFTIRSKHSDIELLLIELNLKRSKVLSYGA